MLREPSQRPIRQRGRRRSGGRLAAAALLLTTGAAFAQEDAEMTAAEAFALPLEELVTVELATGRPVPVAEAPAISTVITAEEIRRSGATDLTQLLESVPGLHVSTSYITYSPLFVMRGLYSESSPYVLFLVDGLPITLYFTGHTGWYWDGMPVENIAYVEVIRGPGSALYGADAVAGVVNVVTRGASDVAGTEVGVRAGSFDTREAWLLHGGRYLGCDVAVAVIAGETEGQRRTVEVDAQSGYDAFFGTSASLAPGPVSTGAERLDASVTVEHGGWRLRLGYEDRDDLGFGAGLNQALDPSGVALSRRHTADLGWHRDDLAPGWDLTLRGRYFRDEFEGRTFSQPPGAFNGVTHFPDGVRLNFGAAEQHAHFEAGATWSGWRDHRLRLGAGFYEVSLGDVIDRRNVTPDGDHFPEGVRDLSDDPEQVFALPQERTTRFVFVQDEWRLGRRFDLTAGVRYDDYSDFGGTVNPRLALVWRASDAWIGKLLYGRAFRPPAYTEQFLRSNATILGNPDLDPEVADTVELGVAWTPSPGSRIGVNLFHYQIRDLILLNGLLPNQYQNVGERSGEGWEVEGRWRFGPTLTVSGSFAYQRSTDELTDTDAGNAPHHQVYLRVDWRPREAWHLGAVFNEVREREREHGDPRPAIADYRTVDAVVQRRLSGRLGVELAVHNLFDEDAREPSPFIAGPIVRYIPGDLPLAGRSLSLALRYRM